MHGGTTTKAPTTAKEGVRVSSAQNLFCGVYLLLLIIMIDFVGGEFAAADYNYFLYRKGALPAAAALHW